MMKRRDFVQLSTLTGMGGALTMNTILAACSSEASSTQATAFKDLVSSLLKDWCDGMIAVQIVDPSDLSIHGALGCPSCSHIHGRCMDAVYPFLYMADVTGDQKYLDAAILVMDWAEHNVSHANGSWTVVPNPKSWKGITVFGAIALAEALHYHGDVLEDKRRQQWMERLSKAAAYVFREFNMSFTNVNYGATAVYGLHLFGKVLDDPSYLARSKELAEDAKAYFTSSNHLLFGECKPSDKLSAKGLPGIDLGYNVEESLNSLVMYALEENDEELLQLLTKSLNKHLEFMLPDGAWDNSWGTRQFKWSYWGSRTCDGSQPAFGMMAHRNPAFGTAAVKNTELLRRCTTDGLLHGGPHYISHGIKPCVHHTFAHAKPLATMLDHWDQLPNIDTSTPLPRSVADGIKYYDELDTALFARGDWRGTLTAYDAIYKVGEYRQATGGALSVLYHHKVGLLLAASMAVYRLAEPYNQQPNPGKDFALTPRVETYQDDVWYTNLFDLGATFKATDEEGAIELVAQAQLKNEAQEVAKHTASAFELTYNCSKQTIHISAMTKQPIKAPTAFVLPLISPTGEEVKQVGPNEITIQKPEGLVKVTSNVPLQIKDMLRSRIFNMVPGAEAVPIMAFLTEDKTQVDLRIEVES